ncbi:MAG TPA: LodA/GoxA family CTQ-dependent oxidase [Thermoanaerobaculia bacterium]|jgi:hypothetical protein|nr:LodA/GoxA family CTQ-dependent oxidase [Thermoanaerobaculia bacterium]
MTAPVLRIHPAIGLARVGNSEEYYLAPESSAGMVQPGTSLVGGLPIQPGTESDPISDQDLRDASGALKRQAQRFRIYQYDDPAAAAQYPYQGQVQEVTLGSVVDGKTVTDIVWTVHLANKKANCWVLEESLPPPTSPPTPTVIGSLSWYLNGLLPPMRNIDFAGTADPSNPQRLTSLVVDAGPRAIHGASAARINFDGATTPSWYQSGTGIQPLPDYPVSFPADHFSQLYSPSGTPVQELGAIETDAQGRLIVLGGQGTATGWYQDGKTFPLNDDVNNDGWFDDTADGPVQATLVFGDGSTLELTSTAWIVSTDPSFAPQIRNAVTLWDEVYDTWLCCFGLDPSIYSGPCMPQDDSGFNKSYQPSFDDDVLPLFRSASLQMFVTSLNDLAVGSHQRLAGITADSDPAKTLNVPSYIRNPYPNGGQLQVGAPRMPLALGDTGASYLTLTKTQYFFLNQWFQGKYSKTPGTPLTAGEQLDKNVLTNCLGGRFSPGIDLTFVVRDIAFYNPNTAKDPNVGPFRVNTAQLNYAQATKSQPFLGVGYIPERTQTRVEPGDVGKFVALPWHTDYNSCATHLPDPNPGGDITNPNQVFDGRNVTLLWSWPAQRPVSVYNYKDLVANGGQLPQQRFSVRGEGTPTIPGPDNGVYPPSPPSGGVGTGPDGSFFEMEQVGRFQVRADILDHWQEIGTVVQAPAIAGYPTTFNQNYFLEVASLMSNVSDVVEPYPNTLTQTVEPTS